MNRPRYMKLCQRYYWLYRDRFLDWVDSENAAERKDLRENITSYCGVLWRLWYVISAQHEVVLKQVTDAVIECVNDTIEELWPDKIEELRFWESGNPSKDIDSSLKSMWLSCFRQQKREKRNKTGYSEIVLKLAYIFKILHRFEDRFIRANCSTSATYKKKIRRDRTNDGEGLAKLGEALYAIYRRFVAKQCRGYEDIAWFLFEDRYHLHFLAQYWKHNLPSDKPRNPNFRNNDWLKSNMCIELLLTLPDSYQVFRSIIRPTLKARIPYECMEEYYRSKSIDVERLKREIEKSESQHTGSNRARQIGQFFEQLNDVDIQGILKHFQLANIDLDVPVATYCDMGEVTFENVDSSDENASKFAELYHMAVMDTPSRKKLQEVLATSLQEFPDTTTEAIKTDPISAE